MRASLPNSVHSSPANCESALAHCASSRVSSVSQIGQKSGEARLITAEGEYGNWPALRCPGARADDATRRAGMTAFFIAFVIWYAPSLVKCRAALTGQIGR